MSLSAVMLICLCLFTLLFEALIDRLEEAFEHAPHYTDMIQKVWRELMILGFISLMVVMANEFALIPNYKLFLAFEFAHLLIFGVSMFYTLTAIVTANRLAYTERQWKRIANLDTNTLVDRLEERLKERADDDNHWKGFAPLWHSLVLDMVKVVDRWEDGEWKMCRLMFLREFGLGNEFDYSKYLKLRLHHKLGHSLHVHPTTWMLVCVCSLLFYIGMWVASEDEPSTSAAADATSSLMDIANDLATNQSTTNTTEIEEISLSLKLSETESLFVVVVPAVLGWVLLSMQTFVLYKVKFAIHKMLKLKGLENVHDLPEYLRRLNAEVEMKYQIPRMWVFADSGDDFTEALMSSMELKFFYDGDVISEQDSLLSKMIILGHGECDAKSKDGKVIGQLVQNDYIGEASLLRDEVQRTSVVAKGDVTVFELPRSALHLLKNDFPAAVQRILEFGEQKYKAGFGHNPPADDGVLTGWMAELQAIQQRQRDDHEMIMAKTMATKAKTGVRKKAAAAAGAAMMATYRTAKEAGQKAIKAAGLPGSGHGVEHGHGNPDRMTGADEIMSRHTAHTYSELSEIALLFNCFTLAFWVMHLMPVTIPKYFSDSIFQTILAHAAVLLPALLLMQEVCPITTKYFCMLETMLEKDQDLIGEVYQHMNRVNAQKNAIKKQLQDVGQGLAKDVGLDSDSITLQQLADMMFKEVDLDGGGTLSHKELRQGLNAFGIYLSKQEYKAIMEIVDPDMDGAITVEEWVDFLTCSDEQLESDDWRAYKAIMNVRRRLASELVKRAMNMKDIMESAGLDSDGDGAIDITGLMGVIFNSMDTDGDAALSDTEFREGLRRFGIQMTESDLELVSIYINEEGTGGELTLGQFREFLHQEEEIFAKQVLPGGKKGRQSES